MQLPCTAFRLLLVTTASTVVAACTDLSVSTIPVARIVVVPESISLETGQSAELRATPTDADGNRLHERGVEWHVGDPSKVIVSSSGVVFALESGSTVVEARSEGAVGRADIRVVSPKSEPPSDPSGDGDAEDGNGGDSKDSGGDEKESDDGDDDDSGTDDDDNDDDDDDGDSGGKGEKGENGKSDERGGKKT